MTALREDKEGGCGRGSDMAFMRPSLASDLLPVLRRGSVLLRAPSMSDYAAWAELRARSRSQLAPFEPRWAEDELTRGAWRDRLRRYQRDAREDLGYAYIIVRESDRALAGGISLSNVRRGVTQAATVGYWVGSVYTRQGLASAALAAIVNFAFDELRLHRLEAACMPGNEASLGVLAKGGFQQEGFARRYLRINGAWEDHILHALLAEDPRP
ncbi:MAG: GNAT family N-acetyltransferase [Hyphomicrobiaceae bacterium]